HVFDRVYLQVERALFGDRHAYGAVAPLVGLGVGVAVELGRGIRVRAAAAGELAALWPEAKGLLPAGFGHEPHRSCVLELDEALDRWELSLFQDEPFRSEQLRGSLAALLGGPDGLFAASLRLAVLLGEKPEERAALLERLRGGDPSPDTVRRALVEVLMQ